MFRQKLKHFGALLALTSLLVLNLHVLAHVFGHDDDDHDAKAPPCALCQTVLAQHTLAAAPSIVAPTGPGTIVVLRAEEPEVRDFFFVLSPSTRGPPAPYSA
jgi:hypothetical protein